PGAKLRTKLPVTAPLPASAQWFAPVGGLLLFITAPLAGSQSELQPGYRAHTEPRCLHAAHCPLSSSRFSLFERFCLLRW
ncbi:RNA-binding protein Raly, partial [Lates japonicus]